MLGFVFKKSKHMQYTKCIKRFTSCEFHAHTLAKKTWKLFGRYICVNVTTLYEKHYLDALMCVLRHDWDID